jgi:hypothetical protein
MNSNDILGLLCIFLALYFPIGFSIALLIDSSVFRIDRMNQILGLAGLIAGGYIVFKAFTLLIPVGDEVRAPKNMQFFGDDKQTYQQGLIDNNTMQKVEEVDVGNNVGYASVGNAFYETNPQRQESRPIQPRVKRSTLSVG